MSVAGESHEREDEQRCNQSKVSKRAQMHGLQATARDVQQQEKHSAGEDAGCEYECAVAEIGGRDEELGSDEPEE